MKRSSLQNRVSKLTPKKFYEIDPRSLGILAVKAWTGQPLGHVAVPGRGKGRVEKIPGRRTVPEVVYGVQDPVRGWVTVSGNQEDPVALGVFDQVSPRHRLRERRPGLPGCGVVEENFRLSAGFINIFYAWP